MTITSCKTIPGIEEPTFFICDVVNVDKAVCYHVQDPTGETVTITPAELIGYSCVNARAFGDLDQHHEALHIKIEELGGGK